MIRMNLLVKLKLIFPWDLVNIILLFNDEFISEIIACNLRHRAVYDFYRFFLTSAYSLHPWVLVQNLLMK